MLGIVYLIHIELATEEDKAWNINYWARLFTATTWEDVKMIAEKDIYMEAATKEKYKFSERQMIEAQDKELELLKQQLAELQSKN